jgi:hypothetical protein
MSQYICIKGNKKFLEEEEDSKNIFGSKIVQVLSE